MHTRSSAPKIFAKFGWQIQTFFHTKWKKRLPNSSQTEYISIYIRFHVLVVRNEKMKDKEIEKRK